jgi:hypothetical protein
MWSTIGEAVRIILVVSMCVSTAIGISAIGLEGIDRHHQMDGFSRRSEGSAQNP